MEDIGYIPGFSVERKSFFSILRCFLQNFKKIYCNCHGNVTYLEAQCGEKMMVQLKHVGVPCSFLGGWRTACMHKWRLGLALSSCSAVSPLQFSALKFPNFPY